MKSKKIQTLLIVSHVLHYQYQDQLFAYAPYAREIELWADLFPEVVIASPLHTEQPPADCIPFEHKNIAILPQLEYGGAGLRSKFAQIIQLPKTIRSLCQSMKQADDILVRCPGNLGFLGSLLAPFFTRHRAAKYAGQWPNYPGEAFSTRLQKRILKSRLWAAPVTVYGHWPEQPNHIIPFFTSVMDANQMQLAREATQEIAFHTPPQILFVGRLTKAKNVHILLHALANLNEQGFSFTCSLIGEGPLCSDLTQLCSALGLDAKVKFLGGLPFEKVLKEYQKADIAVLASETEGWPKAISEAMAFGLVCVGSNRGLVPQMLAHGRGLLVEPGDVASLQNCLDKVITHPEAYLEMRLKAAAWSQQFTLENLRAANASLLSEWWNIDLPYAQPGSNWRPSFD